MNTQQIAFTIDIFESKMERLQEEYKVKHKDSFEKEKMDKYINKKMKKDIKGMILLNLVLPIQMVNN